MLLEGIPAAEIQVQKVTPDEIVGIYSDGEEVHCSHEHLRAWWYGKAPAKRSKPTEEHLRKMREGRERKRAEDRGDITESQEE